MTQRDLSTAEVAHLLGFSVNYVQYLIDDGLLIGYRVRSKPGSPGFRRVTRTALETFAAKHKIRLNGDDHAPRPG